MADTKSTSESTSAESTASGKTTQKTSSRPATFIDALAVNGFQEVDEKGKKVADSDYGKGWNSLTAAKKEMTFVNGDKKVIYSLQNNGARDPLRDIKVYDGENLLWHTNSGMEPTDEFQETFFKKK